MCNSRSATWLILAMKFMLWDEFPPRPTHPVASNSTHIGQLWNHNIFDTADCCHGVVPITSSPCSKRYFQGFSSWASWDMDGPEDEATKIVLA